MRLEHLLSGADDRPPQPQGRGDTASDASAEAGSVLDNDDEPEHFRSVPLCILYQNDIAALGRTAQTVGIAQSLSSVG